MSISIHLLTDFQHIFSGNTTAYGRHIYAPVEKGVKEKGKSFTVTEIITEEAYKAHLEGTTGLGIIPIQPITHTCTFGVIDVDVYNNDNSALVNTIYTNELPLLPFRTKSGGLHLYLFLTKNTKAKRVRRVLSGLASLLGLDKAVEIFPKQEKLIEGQSGNFINLPYYNVEKPTQYLYSEELGEIPLEHAIRIIKEKQTDIKQVEGFFDTISLHDAPPCLQSIYLLNTTEFRNEYLFSLARYYKTKYGDDFEHKISEANNRLDKPHTLERLNQTIISSHRKKDYSYKCNQEPLVSNCNKSLCKKRKYGIGGDEVSNLSYEDFIQYKTEPPYYEWIINGKALKFFSESDIIQQQRFREQCFRILHILPIRLKDINWTAIINTALSNVVEKKIEDGDDISPGAMFKEHLLEFLENRVHAKTKEQVLIDRVYKDEQNAYYVFRSKNLLSFLIIQKQFRYYGQTQIQDKLKTMGGCPKRYYISPEKGNTRVWTLPYNALNNYVEDKDEVLKIDFKEEHLNAPY